MSKVKEVINTLTKELNAHNYNYYVLSSPTISDYDFDLLLLSTSGLQNCDRRFISLLHNVSFF